MTMFNITFLENVKSNFAKKLLTRKLQLKIERLYVTTEIIAIQTLGFKFINASNVQLLIKISFPISQKSNDTKSIIKLSDVNTEYQY